MENIKAVIFDLDNTLGNRFVYSYKMFNDILLKYNPNIINDSILLESIMQDYCTFDEDGSGEKDRVFKRLAKKYNLYFPDYETIGSYWAMHIGDYFEVFEGTYQLLEYLKAKYKLAIITNGYYKNQNHKIEVGNLKQYFDEICISGTVGCKKPDVKIYEITCKKLNVSENEAVFIGDSFSIDILGAKKAGLQAIWLNHSKRIHQYEITTINDINQLKNIL